jgi:hypothetical protein
MKKCMKMMNERKRKLGVDDALLDTIDLYNLMVFILTKKIRGL